MAAPRSSTSRTTRTAAAAKAVAPAAQKTSSKKRAAPARSADSIKIAEILHEIRVGGEALSAQIGRLRHRFL